MVNNVFHFKIGDFNCFAIRDGNDGDSMNRNILLVKTDQQQILIDTGVGCDIPDLPALLPKRLQAVDTSPTMIDVVILSHADIDHIGGALDESGNPAFPNARCIVLREECDFWSLKPERLGPNSIFDEEFLRDINSIPPIRISQLQERLELVEDGAEPVPGIRLIAAPGHTPGYSIIAVSSGEDQLFFIGDLMYDPKDIENPNQLIDLDFDQELGVISRYKIFKKVSDDHALVMAYHIPFPGLGYVSPSGQGYHWHEYKATG
jgi:glyoxylase-like metal-dependent hydrolase (beta-lactamase superfamily II)